MEKISYLPFAPAGAFQVADMLRAEHNDDLSLVPTASARKHSFAERDQNFLRSLKCVVVDLDRG